jgi:hypothetical protein
MKNSEKSTNNNRLNLYIDDKIAAWIKNQAQEMGIQKGAFARMIIISAYKEARDAKS